MITAISHISRRLLSTEETASFIGPRLSASTWHLFVGVAVQAVLITLAAAVFAVSTAWIFRPAYTVPVEVPTDAYLLLPVVAVTVGVLASLVALRRAVTVDPALAFGGG